jgi:hypothetical protein
MKETIQRGVCECPECKSAVNVVQDPDSRVLWLECEREPEDHFDAVMGVFRLEKSNGTYGVSVRNRVVWR